LTGFQSPLRGLFFICANERRQKFLSIHFQAKCPVLLQKISQKDCSLKQMGDLKNITTRDYTINLIINDRIVYYKFNKSIVYLNFGNGTGN